MANVKELRGRIRSVQSIAKITKAMEMVASMKLRKIQQRALAFRPYTEEIRGLMGHLAEFVGDDAELPLFRRRAVKNTGVLLITSDRGLCGAYNANVTAKVTGLRDRLAPGQGLVCHVYGRKGYTWLGRRGYRVERFYADPPLDALDFTAARIVAKDLVDSFLGGKIDEVKLVFTSFVSAARFQPRVDAFLPVTVAVGEVAAQERAAADAAAGSETQRGRTDYLLEPDPETLFNRIIPRYLEIVVFNAMLSSLASEQASRRMAMKGATDAASRMGKELKRVYNRARQESITKELLDIVGGANAVS